LRPKHENALTGILKRHQKKTRKKKEYECNSVFDGRSGLLLIWNEADE
jgi:hypothetical protein